LWEYACPDFEDIREETYAEFLEKRARKNAGKNVDVNIKKEGKYYLLINY
jgi:hypothetical protein